MKNTIQEQEREEKLTKIVISAIKPYTSEFSKPNSKYFAVNDLSITNVVKLLKHEVTTAREEGIKEGEQRGREEAEKIAKKLSENYPNPSNHQGSNSPNNCGSCKEGRIRADTLQEFLQALNPSLNMQHEKN